MFGGTVAAVVLPAVFFNVSTYTAADGGDVSGSKSDQHINGIT